MNSARNSDLFFAFQQKQSMWLSNSMLNLRSTVLGCIPPSPSKGVAYARYSILRRDPLHCLYAQLGCACSYLSYEEMPSIAQNSPLITHWGFAHLSHHASAFPAVLCTVLPLSRGDNVIDVPNRTGLLLIEPEQMKCCSHDPSICSWLS